MIVSIFLMFTLAHIVQVSGTLAALLEKIERKSVKTKVGTEIVYWRYVVVSTPGLCNSITLQIITRLIILKIADKYHLSHHGIVNLSDAVQAAFSYVAPWDGSVLTFYATSVIANSIYG